LPDPFNIITRLKSGGIVRAFRHRDFAIYSLASWCSDNGMWMMRIGMGWLTWDLTHSGAWLGSIVLAQALPSVFLVPFAGAMADRIDRVKIMRVTISISIVLAATLSALTYAGYVTIWALLTFAIIHGIVGTLSVPARVTIGPNLVPRADIAAAIGVSSVMFGSATFLGPAIAGILITQFSIAFTFAGNALMNALLVIALWIIKVARAEINKSHGSILSDVVEGVKYAAAHPGIMPTLILATFSATLVRPLGDLMPGVSDTVFKEGAHGLATLMACMGVGGMVGSFWLANRNRIVGMSRIFLHGTTVYALSTAAFAASGNFTLGMICMVVVGCSMSVSNNASQILIQNAVAGTMRARIMSLYSYNYRTMPALGALAMGTAANVIGFQIPVAAGGILLLLSMIWVYRRHEAMRSSLETIVEDAPANQNATHRPAGEHKAAE
jgi:MFS family permease